MKYRTVTERIGECVGPIDWDHPMAKDRPDLWRRAEKSPEDYLFIKNGMFTPREIFRFGMYDGWPYWKPTPAISIESPLGGYEWVHFNSYGVNERSVFARNTPESPDEEPRSGDTDGAAQRTPA